MTPLKKKRPKRIRRSTTAPTVMLLALSAVLIAVATITMRPEPSQSKPQPPPIQVAADFDTIMIPTPTRTIAKGEPLRNVQFTHIKWPRSRITGEYITDLEHYREAVAITALPKFLPVPVESVSPTPFDSNAVVEGIPDGMRAITVRVDAESAVEGWARSGNYVDVILIRASDNKDLGLESRVIAENVKILSAGRSTDPLTTEGTAPKAPSTVTLLTSQEDALIIKTASNIGKLAFSLRGTKDSLPAIAVSMSQQKLLGNSRPLKAAPVEYQGFARDARGEVYVLAKDRRWTKAEDLPAVFPDNRNPGDDEPKKESDN